ncbi:MAG: polysaccharide biosynthesis C-terminal domain-containing protein [Ruminococcus sp.]|nr:capsular biosynthesis protein [Ruminococcus sp.]MBQ7009934.1 polysaccharide biosynthesis C-terminal domain-containing protein [Ruminococcus sp.]
MNKYKKLAFNTAVFAIGSFGSKILSLFLTRLYSGNLNPSDSNVKDLLEMTANFLIPVFTLSITEALVRYGLDKDYNKREIFTTASCVCGFGLGALVLLSPLFNLIEFIDGYAILLLVYICTSSLRSLCSQLTRVRGLVKLFSFDGILTILLLFIFNLIFISALDMGVRGFMLSVILSDFCSALFLFSVSGIRNYLNISYFRKDLVGVMLRFSLPLIPTALMWIITGFSDRLFLRHMKSSDDAGIYGYAAKIPNLLSIASTVFSLAWNMSAIAENDSKDRSAFYEKVYTSYQSLMYVATAFIIAVVQIITPLLVTAAKYEAYKSVYIYTPFLVIGVLLMCFNQFLSSIYTATRHTANSSWTSLIACVTNIFLNIILIDKFGIQGASIATVLSYLACYVVRIFDARRYVPFKVNHTAFIGNIFVITAMSVVVIKQPPYYPAFLILGFLIVLTANFEPILLTAKKILKR